MIALQNPPVFYKPAKPLIQFTRHLLQVAASDLHSPEAIELRSLSRNSGYCVALGEKDGNQRYVLSPEGLKTFRLNVRAGRHNALTVLSEIASRAYELRVLHLLVAEYGEDPKEAAHFIASHDLELCELRDAGTSAEIATRQLFDDIKETFTCSECGCDTRCGWHQELRGYYSPSYECGGVRREW
jgi:hypothetical protein